MMQLLKLSMHCPQLADQKLHLLDTPKEHPKCFLHFQEIQPTGRES
jgi:hypothetical protein